jgi:TolA-binding protein
MNTPLNCLTCGATFHQYNLTQKYCSATCRNKALYAKRKQQSAEVQQLSAITEQLVRSQERIKDLETKIQDLKQLEQINEVLRATIQQLTAQPTPSAYHIELRKMSITQILDEPYVDFYLDGDGNKTITIDAIYLSMYSNNGALLSEQEMKCNDELLYLMEHNNITEIDLVPCGNKSFARP